MDNTDEFQRRKRKAGQHSGTQKTRMMDRILGHATASTRTAGRKLEKKGIREGTYRMWWLVDVRDDEDREQRARVMEGTGRGWRRKGMKEKRRILGDFI